LKLNGTQLLVYADGVNILGGRRILGVKRDEVTGERRKLRNEKLNDLYPSPNIIRAIKSIRMPQYVIIIAYPLQEWLQERAWMLLYTYISLLACIILPE
jgi:hypothetical protein